VACKAVVNWFRRESKSLLMSAFILVVVSRNGVRLTGCGFEVAESGGGVPAGGGV